MYRFLNFIAEYTIEKEENDDCKYWLQKNKSDYLINYPTYQNLQSVLYSFFSKI